MRTATKYTVVTLDETKGIVISTYANADSTRDALAHIEDTESVFVFVGEPIEFTVDNTPRVTLGGKKERKPRAVKKVKAKNGSTGPIVQEYPVKA